MALTQEQYETLQAMGFVTTVGDEEKPLDARGYRPLEGSKPKAGFWLWPPKSWGERSWIADVRCDVRGLRDGTQGVEFDDPIAAAMYLLVECNQ